MARDRPDWAPGFADGVRSSRLAQPAMHAWTGDERPRLVRHAAGRDDPEPQALACHGLWLPASGRMPPRSVEGRPISAAVTCAFLARTTGRPAADGIRVLVLIWDNASSWHISREVRGWIRAHNQRVKAVGRAAAARWSAACRAGARG